MDGRQVPTDLRLKNRAGGEMRSYEKRVGNCTAGWHGPVPILANALVFRHAYPVSEFTLKRPAPSLFRRHWSLAPGLIFLNHGSFGACPRAVLKAQEKLRREMESSPVQFLWRRYEEHLEPSRQTLSRFVGARSRDVAFVTNATTGVNAVLRSIRFRPGDEILTTSLDYNACRNVLVETARMSRARLIVADIPFPLRSTEDVIDAVLARVTQRTRIALVDHVTSDAGMILPIRRLISELDKRGVETLIDGAHAPGMVALNLAKLGATYYAANLHKWVCAPKGAAFLWVREDKQRDIQPPVISHGNNRSRPGYTSFQDRFDWPATFDPSAWFCAKDAIDWMCNLMAGGWNDLRAHNHKLVVAARRLLCERLGVDPPCPESMLGSMATIPLPADFPDKPPRGKIDREQADLYDQFSIEVPFSRFGRPTRRWFRISAQIYNSMAEYEYLADVLQQMREAR
jgi:isopenicillin-N epimerase